MSPVGHFLNPNIGNTVIGPDSFCSYRLFLNHEHIFAYASRAVAHADASLRPREHVHNLQPEVPVAVAFKYPAEVPGAEMKLIHPQKAVTARLEYARDL